MRVREIKVYIPIYGDPCVSITIESDKCEDQFNLADEDLKGLKEIAQRIAWQAVRE